MENNILKVIISDVSEIISFLDTELTAEERYFFPLTKEELVTLLNSAEDVAYIVVSFANNEIMAYGHMRTFNKEYSIPALGVAVGKKYRGLGISKELCNYMLHDMRRKGYEEVMLKVNNQNRKALQLYLGLDFLIYNWDSDFIWMRKQL